MAEDFQHRYVVIVGAVMGGLVLLVGILGVIVNIE
jgi:hypothetical protein